MEEYIQLIQQCLSLIQMRRNEQMNEIFTCGDYGLKPMFADKYSIAYTACLDDLSEGVKPVIINVSVYKNDKLENINLSYDNFLLLYRAVKNKYKEIEKKYQQYLAELSNNPTEERLQEIIENNIY